MLRYLLTALICITATAADWFPAATVADGKPLSYVPLERASKAWRICVVLPHGKDKYWWGVSWGLAEEAKRQGVKLGIYQAGGYQFLDVQRQQMRDCMRRKADAIIVGAISADGLNDDIAAARKAGVPVVDLVNGVSSKDVSARSLVSFTDMASSASRYLLAHHGTGPSRVLWLPGPEGAAWVSDGERGMRATLDGKQVEILHGGYAPPDIASQMHKVRDMLGRHKVDYVLGNAVAAEASANYLQAMPGKRTAVIAYYATEPVIELIRQGRVLAAPSDATVLQARISIDLAVRLLERKPAPARVSPLIEILDRQSLPAYALDKLLPPKNQWMIQQPLPD